MRVITPLNEDRVMEVRKFKERLRSRGISQRRLCKALREIVSYLGRKEEDDFYDADHTASLDQHIYGALVLIDEYCKDKR